MSDIDSNNSYDDYAQFSGHAPNKTSHDSSPDSSHSFHGESQRQMPHDFHAEESVIAACMLNKEAIEEAAVQLQPEAFYRAPLRIIFAAVHDLYTRNLPIDPITVADNLASSGSLEAVGGRLFLLRLADNTASILNWSTHIQIVKRMYLLRGLIRAGEDIKSMAYTAPDDLGAVVEDAEKCLFNVTEKRVSSEFQSVSNLATLAFEELEDASKRGSNIIGVATGYPDIDKLFHGFRGGDLIIIAARPGVGKTAFALNLAVNSAKQGASVAFLSLEMSAVQLMQRIICSEANVNLSKIRGAAVAESDWEPLIGACDTLSKLNMWIDDTPDLSILELRAKARRELRGKEKGLIIVDYLQLMQPPKSRRDGNRAVEVGEISRGLKILAKEMDMPVIALSQLSRQVETTGKKRPMLSHLRESGSIEQDADIVMFIDRSMDELEAENNDRPDLGTAEIIVAKHRNGELRDIKMTYRAELTKFVSYVDATGY